EINEELKRLKARKDELLKELKKMDEKWGQKLLTLQEELEIEIERMECPSRFGRTGDAVVIEGWVTAKDADELKSLCDRAADGHVFCKLKGASATPTEIPIKYDNPRWLQPFEFLTTMFSRPKYDEIDPTLFIAPTIVLFFGLMLGDVVYGLLLIALGYMLYQGAGTISKSMHDMSIVLMAIGASATVFGIFQGGYFGDFLPVFLGINPPFVLLSPLDNPIAVLQIALVIGITHINMGLLIATYQNLRRKNYRDVLHGQVAWFIIQPCAAVLMFSFFRWAVIDPHLITTAGIGAIIGVFLILIKEGPLGLFGLTGFLGDWLSYARILALALATFGIAMTVNILTKMVADIHPVMIILAALVFVVGQTFNFALQSLGAFIHSLRLQYVEFFGKFYVGGGKEFIPFRVMRTYTELIDEEGGKI
ncbi:MAG: V-type ATP synthase subunit I, partial [Methanocellales archaeon]|nr:V-type ATP synthase subunit I [Methanocellales archaeon]